MCVCVFIYVCIIEKEVFQTSRKTTETILINTYVLTLLNLNISSLTAQCV